MVAVVLGGDRDAFGEIVDRYYQDCLRFSWRLLGRREDAEDAVQETFLSAFRALGQYSERQRFRAWLWCILVNQCRSVSRRRGRWEQRMTDVYDEVTTVSPPGAAGQEELRDALQGALESLEMAQREAFLLKYGEGLDYREMARITGVGVSALKMRVRRTAALMRPRLEAMLRE